ncbi:hypothetical protein Vretifemale_18635, partial [Volvox reticuliferus]
ENICPYPLGGNFGIHGPQNDVDSEARIVHTRTGEFGISDASASPRVLGRNGDLRTGREFHRRLAASKSRAGWLQHLQQPLSTERSLSPATSSTGITGDMAFPKASRAVSPPTLAPTTTQAEAHPASESGLYHAHLPHVILQGWGPANLPRVSSRSGRGPQPQYGTTQDMVLEPAGTSMATAASIQDFLLRTAPSELHPSAAQVVLPTTPAQQQLLVNGSAGPVPTVSPPAGQLSPESLWRVPSYSSHSQADRRLLRHFATVSERLFGATANMKNTTVVEESDAVSGFSRKGAAAADPEGTGTASVMDAGAKPSTYSLPRSSSDAPVDVLRPGSRGLRSSTGPGGARPASSSRPHSAMPSAVPAVSTPLLPPVVPGLLESSTSLSSSPTRVMSCTGYSARPRTLPLLSPRQQGALDDGANPNATTGGGDRDSDGGGGILMGMFLASTASGTVNGGGGGGDASG